VQHSYSFAVLQPQTDIELYIDLSMLLVWDNLQLMGRCRKLF